MCMRVKGFKCFKTNHEDLVGIRVSEKTIFNKENQM